MSKGILANAGFCAAAQTAQMITNGTTDITEVQVSPELESVDSASCSANSSFGISGLLRSATRGSSNGFYRGHHQSRRSMRGNSNSSSYFSSSSFGNSTVSKESFKGMMIIKPQGSRRTQQTGLLRAHKAQPQVVCVPCLPVKLVAVQAAPVSVPAAPVSAPEPPVAASASYAPMIGATNSQVQVKVDVSVNGCQVSSLSTSAPIASPAQESVIAAPEAVVAPVAAEPEPEAEPVKTPEIAAAPVVAASVAVTTAPTVVAAPVAPAYQVCAVPMYLTQCVPQQAQPVNVMGSAMSPVATPAYRSIDSSVGSPAFAYLKFKYVKKSRVPTYSGSSMSSSTRSASSLKKSVKQSSRHSSVAELTTSSGSLSSGSSYSESESYGGSGSGSESYGASYSSY